MTDEAERERRVRALRIERREHQEELEGIVAEADDAGRTLADVLRQHGEGGDRCVVEVGPHRLVGLVAHVGDDLARLVGGTGRAWDVALDRIDAVSVAEPGRAVHRVGRGHPWTLLARARELAAGRAVLEVGRADRADPVRGRLVAVSAHVLGIDRPSAGPVVLSWRAVAWLSEG